MGALLESLVAFAVVLLLVVLWALSVLTRETVFARHTAVLSQQPAPVCRQADGPDLCPPS